jgi:hypothetical protein
MEIEHLIKRGTLDTQPLRTADTAGRRELNSGQAGVDCRRGAKTLGAKLATYKGDAELARKLTGIACDAPFDDPEEALRRTRPKLGEINALYDEADIGTALRRQAERISDLARDYSVTVTVCAPI